MKKRIAINGLGRIGRLVLGALLKDKTVQIVALNDIGTPENIAYLLAHSSDYGSYVSGLPVQFEDMHLRIGKERIPFFKESCADKLPWKELSVDLVLDCSGANNSLEKADKHLLAGARKVLLSSAAGDNIPCVVYGINDNSISKEDSIISAASCSTVGLCPLALALNAIAPIEKGIATTIHALTPTQMVLDDPQKKGNLRRSRSGLTNIIPTTAAFAKAVGRVLPELDGKLSGYAIRVPVARGSLITLYAVVSYGGTEEFTASKLNEHMSHKVTDFFGYTDEELVSSDFAGTTFYSVFDATQTKVTRINKDSYLVEVAAWFDNETSYVSSFIKLASKISAF